MMLKNMVDHDMKLGRTKNKKNSLLNNLSGMTIAYQIMTYTIFINRVRNAMIITVHVESSMGLFFKKKKQK